MYSMSALKKYSSYKKGEIIMEKKKMIFGGKCKGKDLVEAMTAAAKAAGLKDNRKEQRK